MGNPVCHFEFMANDAEKWKAFYGSVFAWNFDDESMPGYTLIDSGSDPHGGMMAKPPQAPGACLTVYFEVDDIDATLAKAVEHGAKVLVPKTEASSAGHVAVFADPDGVPVGILQSD